MTLAAGTPWRCGAEGLTLKIRLTPGSSRDSIEGTGQFGSETVIRARVRAVPDKGKANDALVRLVAGWLGIGVSAVSLVSGGKSRLKSVLVRGDARLLEDSVRSRLAE